MTPRWWAHTIGVGAAMATLACHGDRPRDAPTPAPADARPGEFGPVADAAELRRRLEDVAAAPAAVRADALGRAVLAMCGTDCKCVGMLARAPNSGCVHTGDVDAFTWPALEEAGRYLAQQVAHAAPADRPALLDAIAAIAIAVPRLDTRGLPPAARVAAAPASAGWIGLDGDAALVGAWDQARFGPTGARLDRAPAPRRVPDDQLDAAIAALTPPAAAPAAPATADDATIVLAGTFDGPPAEGQVVVAARAQVAFARAAQILARHGGTIAVAAPMGPNVLRWTFAAAAAAPPPSPGRLVVTVRRGHVQMMLGRARLEAWTGRPPPDTLPDTLRQLEYGPLDAPIVVDVGPAATGEVVAVLDAVSGMRRPVVVLATPPAAGATAGVPGVPQVEVGPFAVVGTVSPDRIQRHLGQRRAPLLACYRELLAEAPTAAPTLDAAFFIDPDGPVTTAMIQVGDPALAACVEAALKRMRFPAPRPGTGGVQVRGPIRFSLR
ncbi:MAG: AgmX/PglI C-terminal domain-containing protein [Myxococcales bacterium]|nr:AgmX/PglI C-terminal domain-containing protein [Myxococcales bacterium]